MPQRNESGKSIPPWAEQERSSDLAWIGENLHVFWPAAQEGFNQSGRGAIVTDTTTLVKHPGAESHPFAYLALSAIEEQRWGDVIRMVKAYNPSWEFVVVLLKEKRESAYCIGVPSRRQGFNYE